MILPMFSIFRELLYLHWNSEQVTVRTCIWIFPVHNFECGWHCNSVFCVKRMQSAHSHNKQMSWSIKMCCVLEAEETFRHWKSTAIKRNILLCKTQYFFPPNSIRSLSNSQLIGLFLTENVYLIKGREVCYFYSKRFKSFQKL